MKYKIKVTTKNIEDGIPHSGEYCPIALAIQDHKSLKEKLKGTYVYTWKIEGPNIKVSIPKKAKNFINKFDNGCKVKPFEFFVDVPNS